MTLQKTWQDPIGRLRIIGATEGLSFLLLIFGAVPLKYLLSQPLGVRVLGPIHGVLFLWLLWELAQLLFSHGFGAKRATIVFLASLFPAGPFLIDNWLKEQKLPPMGK